MEKQIKKLTVRLNPTQYKHLQAQAHIAGVKTEPFIRQLIMGVNLRPRPPDEYGALLRELAAIGNNINQIARVANTERSIADSRIEEAVRLTDAAWRLLKERL